MELHQIADTVLIASQLFTLIALRLAIKRGNEWRDDWVRACSEHLVDRIELMSWRSAATMRDPKTGLNVNQDENTKQQGEYQ